uniref:Putative c2h2-type zn-finger protein n=1 Tax=Ixodes ricinus TaxID=34613 RepID=A0A0K8R4C9_IXORI
MALLRLQREQQLSTQNVGPGQQEEQGGSKGHDCRFCPFSSLFKSNVTAHERTHTGQRPFTCHHCQMAFTTRRGLIAHASTFGDKEHFKCSACSRVFLQKDRLLEHEKDSMTN